tara:strand:- start:16744 stop:17478 length:735 start_codon:yes stop_codon:yes gene_type:complete
MANTERPVEACNWDRRRFISLGPDFRIDANNPQMGNEGNLSWLIYGANDDGDKSSLFQTNAGTLSLHSDRKLEIAAGANNTSAKDDDISITSLKGGITITSNGNGAVTIKAPNILIKADNDVDIIGKNINLNAKGGKVDINGLKAVVSAKLGNLPESMGIDFARNAFAGSFVGGDFLADALGGALPELATAANTFAGKFESQIGGKLSAYTDLASKIDTNALKDQLKGQISNDSIKSIIGGLGI